MNNLGKENELPGPLNLNNRFARSHEDPASVEAGDSQYNSHSVGVVDDDPPPSVWLYLAGLIVTLSGIYAVCYDNAEDSIGMFAMTLAIIGYATSFALRSWRVSLKSLQVPLFACLTLVVLSALLTRQGGDPLSLLGRGGAATKQLQALIAWMAIAQSFTLASDASVLFAGVPAMTMLALVSSYNSSYQVQNAFFVFICAVCFLMIHENYLRFTLRRRRHRRERLSTAGLISQFGLVAVLFLLIVAFTNIAENPVSVIGRQIFPPSAISAITQQVRQDFQPPSSSGPSSRDKVEIATGPTAASDNEVLRFSRVESKHLNWNIYWRGTTFDMYDGSSFSKSTDMTGFEDATDDSDPVGIDAETQVADHAKRFTLRVPDADRSDNVTVVKQTCRITDPSFGQTVYADGDPVSVTAAVSNVQTDELGTVKLVPFVGAAAEVHITSVVPNPTVAYLQSLNDNDPIGIQSRYENLSTSRPPQELQYVDSLVKDASNRYDRVFALKTAIASTCKYNLQAKAAPRNMDVVDYFLFTSKEGYCDSFAATLTVLCRDAGIPARLASGFLQGDEVGNTAEYIVREKHRHVWTEVYFSGVGWLPFDATEGSEDVTPKNGASGNSTGSFIRWLAGESRSIQLAALAVLILLCYVICSEVHGRGFSRAPKWEGGKVREATNREVITCYYTACTRLASRGLIRAASATPVEYLELVRGVSDWQSSGIVELFEQLTEMECTYCYGANIATTEEVERAQKINMEIRRVARKLPRIRKADVSPSKVVAQ